MRILGIDPGLATLGWGMIEADAAMPRFVACGVVTTPAGLALPQRLVAIEERLSELLHEYQPQEIAFEELFFARNVTTAFVVGAARGVAISVCTRHTAALFEYTPMQVKQAVVGYGRAEKQQVQQMVRMILHLDDILRPDDAADAVAVAITHASAGRTRFQFAMK